MSLVTGFRLVVSLAFVLGVLGACDREARYDGRSLSDWARILEHAPETTVPERLRAIDAVTHLGLSSPPAVHVLARALDDDSPDVRLAAVAGIALLGPRARVALPALEARHGTIPMVECARKPQERAGLSMENRELPRPLE